MAQLHVRNASALHLPVTLSSGHVLGFDEDGYSDTTDPGDVELVASGVLVAVTGGGPPPTEEPLANYPRRVFIASTQPSALRTGDVWFDTSDPSATKVREVQ